MWGWFQTLYTSGKKWAWGSYSIADHFLSIALSRSLGAKTQIKYWMVPGRSYYIQLESLHVSILWLELIVSNSSPNITIYINWIKFQIQQNLGLSFFLKVYLKTSTCIELVEFFNIILVTSLLSYKTKTCVSCNFVLKFICRVRIIWMLEIKIKFLTNYKAPNSTLHIHKSAFITQSEYVQL